MKSPRLATDYPDRHLECQEALESMLVSIFDQGAAAGFTSADIAAAVSDLADHRMLFEAANRKVDEEIADIIRRLGL